MGVERAVTRWYAQRHALLAEIETLSAKIAQVAMAEETTTSVAPLDVADTSELAQQLDRTQEKLRLLGPCPKPMMG